MDSSEHKENVGQAAVGEITRILQNWNEGDDKALDKLMSFVVNELRHIARRSLRKYTSTQADDTLQATAIVNEAYLKLRNVKQPHMTQRADFYALCAEIIKHIIIDYVRRKRAACHGGGTKMEPLDEVLNFSWIREGKRSSVEDMLVFQEVLNRLESKYLRESQVLGLKYYVGLTDEEIAKSLDISVPTVRRDLTFARAWIRREVDALTAEIFNRALNIKGDDARKQYLDEVCGGNEALLKDVELLLKKSSPSARAPRNAVKSL